MTLSIGLCLKFDGLLQGPVLLLEGSTQVGFNVEPGCTASPNYGALLWHDCAMSLPIPAAVVLAATRWSLMDPTTAQQAIEAQLPAGWRAMSRWKGKRWLGST